MACFDDGTVISIARVAIYNFYVLSTGPAHVDTVIQLCKAIMAEVVDGYHAHALLFVSPYKCIVAALSCSLVFIALYIVVEGINDHEFCTFDIGC